MLRFLEAAAPGQRRLSQVAPAPGHPPPAQGFALFGFALQRRLGRGERGGRRGGGTRGGCHTLGPHCSPRPLPPASAPGWAQTHEPGGGEPAQDKAGVRVRVLGRGDAGGRGSRQPPGPRRSLESLLGELPGKGRAPCQRCPRWAGHPRRRGDRRRHRGAAEVAGTGRTGRQPCPTCPCAGDEDLRVLHSLKNPKERPLPTAPLHWHPSSGSPPASRTLGHPQPVPGAEPGVPSSPRVAAWVAPAMLLGRWPRQRPAAPHAGPTGASHGLFSLSRDGRAPGRLQTPRATCQLPGQPRGAPGRAPPRPLPAPQDSAGHTNGPQSAL